MEKFAKTMFMAIPSVCNEIENLPAFLREWRKNKLTIPTYSGIIISEDNSQVLMVQGYSGNSSFPRGKMEGGENPEECAVREVFKEVGLDISDLIKSDGFTFLREWRKYKLTIPTYGAIFISKDNSHVLMVKRYSGNWSFPRGKIQSGENPEECAVREVFEEVGLDISDLIKSDGYSENNIVEKYSTLGIINIAWLFQIELAFKNYLDHHVTKTPSLPYCRMEKFAKTMFMAIPSVCNEIENLPAFLRE
ncbi:hypothetical protein HHI36_003706 [Cryptolaemus montrouzieri]|uniref:Nudix hydrolase domain-containing protein n=1 Tax=Cryptolaemus montrouzieri TaxID=559131 RepID=A0ABD2PE60_9CUCU